MDGIKREEGDEGDKETEGNIVYCLHESGMHERRTRK
jgi:hypothetical protein